MPPLTRPPAGHVPARVFLDTSILQTLLRYGEQVYECVSLREEDRLHQMPQGPEHLRALGRFMRLAERGSFQFMISEGSLDEVAAAADPTFLQWAYDVLGHTEVGLSEDPPRAEVAQRSVEVDHPSFGYLGRGDRRLISEALALDSDTFLTMERRLTQNGSHLWQRLGIWVTQPIPLWDAVGG
jgi:hypothetical protein